ncbi:heavy metal translocating P-type ATPase [Castellaniella defragrans]|uniref:heavy metal translocating P-type ATPase n=1 Tax=Castellaniella defragrans TaxID=75697 RepID=UPI00069499AD|nr:heavy metal translocating P-type ATPase [Castellaniella defragrans]
MPHAHGHDAHGHPAAGPDHGHPHGHDHGHARAPGPCGHGCGAADPRPHGRPDAVPLAPSVEQGADLRTELRIQQMDCPTEEALIRKALSALPAVRSLDFNLMRRVLTVVHAPDALESILRAIRDLGFTPEQAGEAAAPAGMAPEAPGPWWPLAASGAAALAAEAAHWAEAPWAVPAVLAVLAIAGCGLGTYRKGWTALRHGQMNINALMSIAVTGALVLGQWAEAAMVMVLFTLAERIEARSLDRARRAVQGLLRLAPERASVRQADGGWRDVPARDVSPGALVRVRPGERIALDGRVESGRSAVDQSPITGESLPVDKTAGDPVYAGTINGAGELQYRALAAAGDSTLARIIRAIESAQSARAPTQRFVDRFARVYTPLVVLLAVAIAVLPPLLGLGGWHDWIYKALVLLVIACPCALVISTPVSIVSGLAAAARHGVLVKGGVHLEQGRLLRWIALDKTGTVTHGRPVLTDALALDAADPARSHALAAALAARSDHPVSRAVAQGLDAGPAAPVEAFEALAGRGTRGLVDGRPHLLGNHRLIHERGLCSPDLEARLEALERQGKTVVLLADEHRALALYAVADTIKPDSAAAIQALHALGVRTAMLSGDNPHTVAAIAAQAGIDRAEGDLLPEDKLRIVGGLAVPGTAVGMVGDGINDAPALARADVGFAMGAMGTDAAIETADVALMDDDLRKIPWFIRLSRATHRILVQNIAIALGIKAVFLVLTVAGLGTLWMAVFADVGASLLVVGNGLRLLRR